MCLAYMNIPNYSFPWQHGIIHSVVTEFQINDTVSELFCQEITKHYYYSVEGLLHNMNILQRDY